MKLAGILVEAASIDRISEEVEVIEISTEDVPITELIDSMLAELLCSVEILDETSNVEEVEVASSVETDGVIWRHVRS